MVMQLDATHGLLIVLYLEYSFVSLLPASARAPNGTN